MATVNPALTQPNTWLTPSTEELQGILDEVRDTVEPLTSEGSVADYIPGLAEVKPNRFGMAIATVDGEVVGTGDWAQSFSIQSISKLFALSLAYAHDGDTLWERVSREPSGDPFNSLMMLERYEGIPRNPFINTGAMVIVDRLLSSCGTTREFLLPMLREESGNPHLNINDEVARSEAERGYRNAAGANLLASYDNLENSVDAVLEEYFNQCAIEMSCGELALAGRLFAREGHRADGTVLLTRSEVKRINSIMLTCGTYDAAGEFAYRVGLPAKSGVGGGILAIIPGRCAVCVWSPGLDERGNSLAGVAALDELTRLTGWSIF